ncbi:hypothetical protein NKH10_16600 [Mesorhizobium sp. M1340]
MSSNISGAWEPGPVNGVLCRGLPETTAHERVDILTAINILKSQGYDHDELIAEITKVFYVDLDAFNEIVRVDRRPDERAA